MKNFLFTLVAFCFLCCGYTIENRFDQIESIAINYRHEYLSDVSDGDSVFFLIVFFEDSMENKMLINANDVQIPHFLIRAQPNTPKNTDMYKGYVESGKNFFFIYDLTQNVISKEFFSSIKTKKDLSNNKQLMKYNEDDYFLDSHTDIYNISPDLKMQVK